MRSDFHRDVSQNSCFQQGVRVGFFAGFNQEVVYEKSNGTKMNNLDLCLEVVSRSRQLLTLNISETVRDRDFVPKDHQQEMAHGRSNGHVTNDVT